MSLIEQLLHLTARYHAAPNTASRMITLYQLRTFLNETDNIELFCSLEVELHMLGQQVPNRYKDRVREHGFQFPEDLDNAIELLCDEEESDGLF